MCCLAKYNCVRSRLWVTLLCVCVHMLMALMIDLRLFICLWCSRALSSARGSGPFSLLYPAHTAQAPTLRVVGAARSCAKQTRTAKATGGDDRTGGGSIGRLAQRSPSYGRMHCMPNPHRQRALQQLQMGMLPEMPHQMRRVWLTLLQYVCRATEAPVSVR